MKRPMKRVLTVTAAFGFMNFATLALSEYKPSNPQTAAAYVPPVVAAKPPASVVASPPVTAVAKPPVSVVANPPLTGVANPPVTGVAKPPMAAQVNCESLRNSYNLCRTELFVSYCGCRKSKYKSFCDPVFQESAKKCDQIMLKDNIGFKCGWKNLEGTEIAYPDCPGPLFN